MKIHSMPRDTFEKTNSKSTTRRLATQICVASILVATATTPSVVHAGTFGDFFTAARSVATVIGHSAADVGHAAANSAVGQAISKTTSAVGHSFADVGHAAAKSEAGQAVKQATKSLVSNSSELKASSTTTLTDDASTYAANRAKNMLR